MELLPFVTRAREALHRSVDFLDVSVQYSDMGRQREFDEDHALAAATQVFWQQGFDASSMPTLLDAMGLSKSSFYEAFGSKDALFERCINGYADRMIFELRAMLERSPSGLKFIRGVLLGVADQTKDETTRLGCLIMNTATEFGQREPAVARMVTQHLGRFEDVFARALERAKDEGEWRTSRPTKSMARFLVCGLSGLKTMVKAGASRANIRETASLLLSVLEPKYGTHRSDSPKAEKAG